MAITMAVAATTRLAATSCRPSMLLVAMSRSGPGPNPITSPRATAPTTGKASNATGQG